jgi:hypothetical protein
MKLFLTYKKQKNELSKWAQDEQIPKTMIALCFFFYFFGYIWHHFCFILSYSSYSF